MYEAGKGSNISCTTKLQGNYQQHMPLQMNAHIEISTERLVDSHLKLFTLSFKNRCFAAYAYSL